MNSGSQTARQMIKVLEGEMEDIGRYLEVKVRARMMIQSLRLAFEPTFSVSEAVTRAPSPVFGSEQGLRPWEPPVGKSIDRYL